MYNNCTKFIVEYINGFVDDTLEDGTSDQKENGVMSHEQDVMPDVPNKGTGIAHTLEDKESEDGKDNVPKGPSIRIQKYHPI